MPERGKKTETVPVWKALKLVSAAKAVEFGVETESPIFVSPNIESQQKCYECHKHFGPLVYPTGREVRAHHSHLGVGIYYNIGPIDLNYYEHKLDMPFFGWVGLLGERKSKWQSEVRTSSRVCLTRVLAFCKFHGSHEPLDQGYLIEGGGELSPICEDLTNKYHSNVSFLFRIEEDHILFSQI